MSLAPRIDSLDIVNVRSSEGAGTTTLTSSDSRQQIFQLSAARTVVLPSTGVLKGHVYVLENTGAFDLTIQSSNLSVLIRANGTNITATIQKGRVVLVALQDAPTTPAHWRVQDLYEEGTFSPSELGKTNVTGTPSYVNPKYYRINNIMYARIEAIAGYSQTTASALSLITFTPVGLRGIGNSTIFFGSAYIATSTNHIAGAIADASSGNEAVYLGWNVPGTGILTLVSLHFHYEVT